MSSSSRLFFSTVLRNSLSIVLTTFLILSEEPFKVIKLPLKFILTFEIFSKALKLLSWKPATFLNALLSLI